MSHEIEIRPFIYQSATVEDFRRLNAFENTMRSERVPEDPPVPDEECIQWWRNKPSSFVIYPWLAYNAAGMVVGEGFGMTFSEESNLHMLHLNLEVHPAYRRQGLAKRLLQPLVTVARQEKRRLLAVGTNDRVPAGAAFMERLGARAGLVSHTNQLVLAELNSDLLRRWQEQGQQQANAFALGLWEGPFPEAELEAIAQLHHVMNTAPRDNLDMEDFQITPQQLREWDQNMVATGTERWVIYAREKATDQLAGFTAVYWSPNRGHLLFQGDTGIFPQYRKRGLGRWIKAAMLDKVLRERPGVQFVRTGNADSNAAMLKINHELGFKPFIAECYWQVEREKVEKYLSVP